MLFPNRKTIGVFINKSFAVFDNTVFRTLEREGKRLNYDIVVFASAGYYLTESDYDIQEKNIFHFAAIEKLDGLIIVPESYEQGEFRKLLNDMLHRAHCPVVAIRHEDAANDCVFTDEHDLCLFGEPDSLMQEEGNRACLVHAIRDSQDCEMPMISFDRSDLLPPMAQSRTEPQMLYVKLLHQNRHNFGYSVFRYAEGEVPSRSYVQTNALMSIALTNIYRRRELMQLYEERRLSSITDMMTGLLNRRGLMERIEPVWRDFAGKRVAFVCIDMDHLKQINDTFGHTAGDFAIRLVGRAIRETMPTGATGARIGGDEYVVFMPEGEKAGPFVAAFEEALQRLNDEEDRSFSVTASMGMAVKRLNGMDTIEKCIQEGDKQMYRVKEARHMNRIN